MSCNLLIRRMDPFIGLILLLVIILSSHNLHAHSVGQSYIYLRVYDDKITGTFEITFRDLNKALDFKTADTRITETNLNDRIEEVHNYYRENVQFFNGQNKLPIIYTDTGIRELSIGKYILISFIIIENEVIPDALQINYKVLFDNDPDHLGLLVIEHFWNANIYNNESNVSLIFGPEDSQQQLSLSGYSVMHGFIGVVKLGVKHIWKGIDHILFLVALILPSAMIRRSDKWEPVRELKPAVIYLVKIVTLFTIAHSITLSIAALGLFSLPTRLVESVIAISIAVAALDIIFPIFKRKIAWVAIIFGLFHGFGFARVLTKLGVLRDHMALSLFGFNLGVEIGQVVVIGIIFPVLYLIRENHFYPRIIMRYGAVAMILLAGLWFVDRAFLHIDFTGLLLDSLAKLNK